MSLKERWENFKLWWKYPFLRPRTLTRDKYCSELFSYTLLHLLPEGWLKAFGHADDGSMGGSTRCSWRRSR